MSLSTVAVPKEILVDSGVGSAHFQESVFRSARDRPECLRAPDGRPV